MEDWLCPGALPSQSLLQSMCPRFWRVGEPIKWIFGGNWKRSSLFLGDSLHSSKCIFQPISRRRQSHRERRQLHLWRIDDGTFEWVRMEDWLCPGALPSQSLLQSMCPRFWRVGEPIKWIFGGNWKRSSLFLGDSLHSSKCIFQPISRRRQSHRERRQLHHWRIDDGTFEFGGPGWKWTSFTNQCYWTSAQRSAGHK